MNKIDLEKLINKPRGFRNHKLSDNFPVRQTMIILGSEVPENRESSKSYSKLKAVLQNCKFYI
jgi:hypothetical protein